MLVELQTLRLSIFMKIIHISCKPEGLFSGKNNGQLIMTKRKFTNLEEFKANLHADGATVVDFSDTKVPCILVNMKKYEHLLGSVHDRKIRADTLLDIFYDGRDVFVDVQIKVLETDFEENFLLHANNMIDFFESLALSGMIAVAPDSNVYSNSANLFVIQLPKKEAAERALEIIKSNLKKHS
jgi:hypothetical protein